MSARRLPVADARAVRRRFAQLLGQHRRAVATVCVAQLAAALASVGIPKVLGLMVDTVAAGDVGRLHVLVAVVVALAAVNAVLTGAGEYLSRVLGERVFAQLRETLVSSVMHLPLSVVESAGTGDLLGRTSHDLEKIRFVVQRGVSKLMVVTMTIVTVLVAALVASPVLGVCVLAGAVIVVPLCRWYLRYTVNGYKTMNALWAEADGIIAETADQADTVAALNLGVRRNRVFDRALQEAWSTEQYTLWIRILFLGGLRVAVMLPLIAVLLWGAWLLSHDMVSLGAVTTVALYSMQVRGPVTEVSFWLDSVLSATAAMARIVGVELVEPDREATSGEVVAAPPRVRGVSYAYREGHDVLHDVDLEVVPGERLVVVGPSGSGKSTLGRMLAGIHPPTRGRVTVGEGGADGLGVDLTSLTEDALHRQVVLVTQEHHVFACSLADNLRIARSEASEEEIRQALEVVGAGAWVEALPEGLATRVGAGGIILDPGQAQQVALARIVLMDPATLILDEATSLLDPGSARSAERALDAVLAGRTVIAIAHRLDTAAAADRVAVVIDGRIVELGPHEELVAAGGEYTRLWEAWTSR